MANNRAMIGGSRIKYDGGHLWRLQYVKVRGGGILDNDQDANAWFIFYIIK